MKRYILVLGILSSGTAVAKKVGPGFYCLSLFNQLHRAAIVDEAGKIDRLRISPWQRFLHFTTLLDAEEKLARGLPLSTEESDVLTSLQRRTGVPGGEGKSAALILEYTANLARSSYESLKVGERLLRRFLAQRDQPGRENRARTEFYWDRAVRLILAAFAAADASEAALRDEIRVLVQNHAGEGSRLRRLAEKLGEPETPAPEIAPAAAPVARRPGDVGRALREHTPYLVDRDAPTPVAFADKFLHRFDAEEGYGSFGVWLRPGAMIRIEAVYPAETPRGEQPPAADHIYTNKHGVPMVLAYELRFDPADAYWDREMTEPYVPGSEPASAQKGYVTPTVFEQYPLYRMPTTQTID